MIHNIFNKIFQDLRPSKFFKAFTKSYKNIKFKKSMAIAYKTVKLPKKIVLDIVAIDY